MSPAVALTIGILIGLILGAIGLYAFLMNSGRNLVAKARQDAETLTQQARLEAENKAKEIELTARPSSSKSGTSSRRKPKPPATNSRATSSRLTKREDMLDRKLDTLSVKEKHLDDLESQARPPRQDS